MSGTIAIALASLLLQQATPHPSTLRAYEPPAVRPYQPASNFGREHLSEGDTTGELRRGPITRPVDVDAYDGSYEPIPGVRETVYDMAVRAAEGRADRTAGPLEGRWEVLDGRGEVVAEVLLSDRDGLVEGGWAGVAPGVGSGAAWLEGRTLRLERGGVLTLNDTADGARGALTLGGRRQAVTVRKAD